MEVRFIPQVPAPGSGMPIKSAYEALGARFGETRKTAEEHGKIYLFGSVQYFRRGGSGNQIEASGGKIRDNVRWRVENANRHIHAGPRAAGKIQRQKGRDERREVHLRDTDTEVSNAAMTTKVKRIEYVWNGKSNFACTRAPTRPMPMQTPNA